VYAYSEQLRSQYKILATFKKKSEVYLSLANDNKCKTIDDKLRAFCGKSKYITSSENYFIDSTSYYRTIVILLNINL